MTYIYLPHIAAEPPANLPEPANDNWGLKEDWITTAEFMQWIRLRRERLRRELAKDFTLRHCPKHRLTWEISIAMERCARWHLLGIRDS